MIMAKRRARRRDKGSGSVFFRTDRNRWYAEFGGRQKMARSKEEAELVLREMEAEPPVSEHVTVKQWVSTWIALRSSSWAPATLDGYVRSMNQHILPQIGHLWLHRLEPSHIDEMFLRLESNGVTASVRRLCSTALCSCLSLAVKKRRIPASPMASVERPVVPTATHQPFTVDEIALIFTASQGHRLEAMFLVGMFMGLRPSELLGLRWMDINFDDSVLSVNVQASVQKGGVKLAPLKTRSSYRTIPLPERCRTALLKRRMDAMREGFASPERTVFCTENGNPMGRHHFLATHFKPMLARAGVTYRGPHQMRHTTATLLAKQKESPRTVQKLLGHSSVAVTLEIYTTMDHDDTRSALDTLGKAIG